MKRYNESELLNSILATDDSDKEYIVWDKEYKKEVTKMLNPDQRTMREYPSPRYLWILNDEKVVERLKKHNIHPAQIQYGLHGR